ncbi:MAG: flagellar hook-length control protein FliK [Pseudomonadota bacterium]|nr:flagellar hook-length control protein FliK [Pseudomonadota bacterium]
MSQVQTARAQESARADTAARSDAQGAKQRSEGGNGLPDERRVESQRRTERDDRVRSERDSRAEAHRDAKENRQRVAQEQAHQNKALQNRAAEEKARCEHYRAASDDQARQHAADRAEEVASSEAETSSSPVNGLPGEAGGGSPESAADPALMGESAQSGQGSLEQALDSADEEAASAEGALGADESAELAELAELAESESDTNLVASSEQAAASGQTVSGEAGMEGDESNVDSDGVDPALLGEMEAGATGIGAEESGSVEHTLASAQVTDGKAAQGATQGATQVMESRVDAKTADDAKSPRSGSAAAHTAAAGQDFQGGGQAADSKAGVVQTGAEADELAVFEPKTDKKSDLGLLADKLALKPAQGEGVAPTPVQERLAALAKALDQAMNGTADKSRSTKETSAVSKTSEPADGSKLNPFQRSLEQMGRAAGRPTTANMPTAMQSPLQSREWAGEMTQRLVMMVSTKLSSARIQLNPQEMGTIDVKVAVKHDQAHVVFTSQVAPTRDALEQAIPRLREMMEQNGVALGDVDVRDQGARESHDQAGGQQRRGERAAESAAASDDGAESTATNSSVALGLVDYYA